MESMHARNRARKTKKTSAVTGMETRNMVKNPGRNSGRKMQNVISIITLTKNITINISEQW